ncbi:MAG: MotA/TolQ/ExbB proton channel family protein [Puniceicoccaceae bacterium]|nr:MAG: MotA/TolQ/ExbB proton channel family protein [Puniceicoccaceae bacterium]
MPAISPDWQSLSLLELFALGGPIMWALLALSLLAVVLFLERVLYLHRGQIRSAAFFSGIKNIVRKRRLVEALTVCEDTPGPVAAMVKAGLLHYEEDEETIRNAVREAALVEIPALQRRIGAIGAIGQAAPMVGLLGTILGMIQTFHRFEIEGAYVHAGLLAGGLWQALITTATGIAIGVLCLLGHHFLDGRVRAVIHDMEWVGHNLLEFLRQERSALRADSQPQPPARTASGRSSA